MRSAGAAGSFGPQNRSFRHFLPPNGSNRAILVAGESGLALYHLGMGTYELPEGFQVPAGFRWGAAEAAIKHPGRLDVGILIADRPASAAGVFTQNRFCAAPVVVCREILAAAGSGRAPGVVVNSGCANAATGEEGLRNARAMGALAAGDGAQAGTPDSRMLVCSTGTIGVQLPMDRLAAGIACARKVAGTRVTDFHAFARAILTTDTREKIATATFTTGRGTARLVGCAKGSGMIHPDMATLLAFVATDAAVEPAVLADSFHRAVERSLNCLTVDGDTSTNDTALVLASGASGVAVEARDTAAFDLALLGLLQDLTRQLARDGEGATKLIEVRVGGAGDFASARRIAHTVAKSPLVKTAIYGRDANWGRIVCAVGYSGEDVDPGRVRLDLGPLRLFENGAPVPFDEEKALAVLAGETVVIDIDLGLGGEEATVWTCDLTEKYIEINGSYRT